MVCPMFLAIVSREDYIVFQLVITVAGLSASKEALDWIYREMVWIIEIYMWFKKSHSHWEKNNEIYHTAVASELQIKIFIIFVYPGTLLSEVALTSML